jgi:hypothetical protein
VTVDELRRLSVPQTTPLRMANPVPPAGTEEPRQEAPATVEAKSPVAAPVGRAQQLVGGNRKARAGSITGHHFGPEELAKLGGSYLSLARELIGDQKLVASGRKVVTAGDLAIFLMLLRVFRCTLHSGWYPHHPHFAPGVVIC